MSDLLDLGYTPSLGDQGWTMRVRFPDGFRVIERTRLPAPTREDMEWANANMPTMRVFELD